MAVGNVSKKNRDYFDEIMLVLLLFSKFFLLYNDNEKSIPIIIYCAVVLLSIGVKATIKYFNSKTLLLIVAASLLAIVISAITGEYNLLFVVFGAIGFIDKGIKRYIKWFGIGLGVGLALSVFLSLTHAIPASFEAASKPGFYLCDFGLGQHNTPFMFYVTMCFCLFITTKKRLTKTLLFAGAVLLFVLTYSRTGFLCVIFLYVFSTLKIFRAKHKITKTIFVLLPIILLGASYFIALKLNNDFFNKILSSRPWLFNVCVKNFEVNLFGNDFSAIRIWDDVALIVDNFFLNTLYGRGAIVFVIYITMYCALFYMIAKTNDTALKCSMVVFMIYGLFEANIHSYVMNFPIGMLVIIFISEFKAFNKIKQTTKVCVQPRISGMNDMKQIHR